MAATLDALHKAPVLNQDGVQISSLQYTLGSSDSTVVHVSNAGGGNPWTAIAGNAGTATLTATRIGDGAVSTLDVEVVAAAPFSIALGPEVLA